MLRRRVVWIFVAVGLVTLCVWFVRMHQPAKPSRINAELVTTKTAGIRLKLIPAGTFRMGSADDEKDAYDDEKPLHEVRITRPFYLGITEITRGQFRHFVADTGYKTEAEKDGTGSRGWDERLKQFKVDASYTWLNPGFEQTDDDPVVNVSWDDALEFCKWLSRAEGVEFRLPTEAEWEYACRAGTTTRYSSGDDPETLAAVGNVADGTAKERFPRWTTIAASDGYVYTAPVGRFRANAFGLYDMLGNVFEWCADWYSKDYYAQSPGEDPTGPAQETKRVFRGGGWNGEPRGCRSAFRDGSEFRSSDTGFRVARVRSTR